MTEEDKPNVPEHLLVLRAQLGHHDALRALHDRYNRRLLYYLRRMVSNDAEDLLQEVWIKVVRNVGSLEEPGAFKAWLYRTAHNQALSKLRKRTVDVGLEAIAEEPEAPSPNDDDADTSLFEAYGGDALHRGLSRLTSVHCEVLTLRFLEELSYDEIASIVQCSVGTVRSRLHYAKKSLLHVLRNSDQDTPTS